MRSGPLVSRSRRCTPGRKCTRQDRRRWAPAVPTSARNSRSRCSPSLPRTRRRSRRRPARKGPRIHLPPGSAFRCQIAVSRACTPCSRSPLHKQGCSLAPPAEPTSRRSPRSPRTPALLAARRPRTTAGRHSVSSQRHKSTRTKPRWQGCRPPGNCRSHRWAVRPGRCTRRPPAECAASMTRATHPARAAARRRPDRLPQCPARAQRAEPAPPPADTISAPSQKPMLHPSPLRLPSTVRPGAPWVPAGRGGRGGAGGNYCGGAGRWGGSAREAQGQGGLSKPRRHAARVTRQPRCTKIRATKKPTKAKNAPER